MVILCLSFHPFSKMHLFFGWAKEYSLKCISVVIVVLYHIYYWSNFVFALATSSKHNGIDAKGDAVNVAVIKQTIAHRLASILVTMTRFDTLDKWFALWLELRFIVSQISNKSILVNYSFDRMYYISIW